MKEFNWSPFSKPQLLPFLTVKVYHQLDDIKFGNAQTRRFSLFQLETIQWLVSSWQFAANLVESTGIEFC